jgi:hypothetical protein
MGIVRPLFQCTKVSNGEECASKQEDSRSPEHIGTEDGGTNQRYNMMYSDATVGVNETERYYLEF